MAISAGTRLGPYEIVALIGAGGMGEVYKASDTRLNRTVAIKVLPPHWADDPEMKQRFDREAKTIASLSHSHICTLHDIGRESPSTGSGQAPSADSGQAPSTGSGQASSGQAIDFLVMEYLEGQTLAKRLERGPLPLKEAVEVAIAMADALDKAHREGVVHRDLKPANVMLTPSGPKLLDFGLAKLNAAARPASSPSGSAKSPESPAPAGPTRPNSTSPGMLVGTLQYMAPEQIEGADADARTDIFALGGILFEMVTGTKAFEGKNRALLIAAIATLELDPLSKSQPAASGALDHVAKRCLAKDPEDRWQTAHDLLVQLRWIADAGVASGPAPARTLNKRVSLLLAAALVLVGVLAVPALLSLRGSTAAEAFQFRVPVAGLSSADIAISPDGQTLALVARPNTQEASSLYVRPAGATTFRKLGGTDDAALPFWSPDSRTIAFAAGGRLKRVDASGGAPKDLGDAQGFAGGAWNSEGTIVFGSAKGLYRLSAEGGKPEGITVVEKAETGHFWPSFLPDGKQYVYLAWSGEAGNRAVFAGTLGSKEKTRLMAAESNAVSAPGYLLFHREATLFAQPFDAGKVALAGDPLHVADQLGFSAANGRGYFDVSQNGVLLYFQAGGTIGGGPAGRGNAIGNAVFGWRDRTGRQLGASGCAEKKPLAVRRDVPLVADRVAGRDRVEPHEQPVRDARFDPRPHFEIDRHHAVVRRTVVELLPVFPPSRLSAAADGRDAELLIQRRKRDHVHLERSRFVGGIGEPFPVVRELRFVLSIRPRDHRDGLLVRAGHREHVQILVRVLSELVDDVLPVLGPVFDEFAARGFEERRFRADPVGVLDVDVRTALPVRRERDAVARGGPHRIDVIGRIERQPRRDPCTFPIDDPDVGARARVLSRDGDELAIGGQVDVSIRARLSGLAAPEADRGERRWPRSPR